jgi:hypothetical protein
MKSKFFGGALIALCTFSPPLISVSYADTINVNGLNIFRDFRADNDVGIGGGDLLQFGANIDGGSAGVTIQGIFTQTGGSQMVTSSAPCGPLAVNANFCANQEKFSDAKLNDSWQVQFNKGAAKDTFNLPTAATIPLTPVNFPHSVTISANPPSLTNPNGDPTISWVLPAGTNANAFRVNIFDKSVVLMNGTNDVIESNNLKPMATNFTPTVALKPGGSYAINFQVIQTRDHNPIPLNSGNADILTRSNSFFDFSPPTSGEPPVISLPTIHNGVYYFRIDSVGPSSVTFIDPKIAIGYDYAIGAGDPNFASVILPDVGGGHFDLSFQLGGKTVTDALDEGVQFFFGTGGVSAFEVTGIDPSAMLDPGNAGAFVTGLTFVSAGEFTGTMTPITISTSVPEPSTWALTLLGFAGLGFAGYRRTRSRPGAITTA